MYRLTKNAVEKIESKKTRKRVFYSALLTTENRIKSHRVILLVMLTWVDCIWVRS